MAAPIGPHVGEVLESVRNAMIELLLIGIGFCVRLADTFCDDFGVAFLMTRVLAILALHTGRIFEEFPAKSTTHDVVELLEHKLMAVKFIDFFFALADGAFTIKTNVEGSTVFELFGYDISVSLHE